MSNNCSEQDITSSYYYNPIDNGLNVSSGYSSSSSSSYIVNYFNKVHTDKNKSIVKPVMEKKKYSCSHCPKFFSRPSALETHNYTHTLEKPFQCLSHNCGKRFSVVSNLLRHFKTHQKSNNSGNKISSQDRLRCVRKLIRRNPGNNKNHIDQSAATDCYGNVIDTTLGYEPAILRDITSQFWSPLVLQEPRNGRFLPLPPILVEEAIAQFVYETRVPPQTSVQPYMCRTVAYSDNQTVDQMIGERSATIEYEASINSDDLGAVFTHFDDFDFLQQS